MSKIIEPFIIGQSKQNEQKQRYVNIMMHMDHDEGKLCSGTFYGDVVDTKKLSFLSNIDYPTLPTGAHIQFVDAFTGVVYWFDNR